ncbi:fimbria/pilus outer membrane usher protein [Klebsiella michiganensis]|uniref:fimbria/pilus outer membrane usher protein n=1 Tax=Klebsiella michiganensis TaxID=1134687 RepID=UPI00403FF3F7
MRTIIHSGLTPGKLSLLIKHTLYSVAIIASLSMPLSALEFNTDMIDAEDRENIDLSQFEKKGYIPVGTYLVRIQINKNTLPKAYHLEWVQADNESGSQLCLTKERLAEFGFADAFIEPLHVWAQKGCLDLSHQPELIIRLDKANMVLTLTVPQAWMKYQAKNWTPPEYWDDGIAGLMLDYNLYASQYTPSHGDSNQSVNSYGTLGFNLGAWRLRSDYQYDQSFIERKSTGTSSSLPRTYLFRPIPSLASKFTMGQYDLSSGLYDIFHFTGASLESDEQMLPPDLRGYAPQISGIAQTNAKVTITQNSRTLYQTTVSPGPFTIADLGTTLQGQLDVTIEEEDGRKSTFQVGSASIPYLTRKGQVRYKSSLGKPTSTTHNDVNNPLFWTGEASWGWLSDISLYGGAIVTADDYQTATGGVGFNLNRFGSFSLDITRAEANLRNDDQGKQRGFSYRANYAKRFEETNSQVTFAGYRFSDKEYVTMSEYISSRDGSDSSSNEKESYVLSFNQYVAPLELNTYLSITRNTYWNSQTNTNYSFSLSRSFDIDAFKNISASLAMSRVSWNNNEENQYYLSLSLPLENNRNIMYSLQRYGDDATTQTATWYDGSDRNNPWNMSVSGTDKEFGDGEAAMRGYYQHYSPYGRLNVNGSVKPSSYRSFSAGWNGSFTATRYGAALHDYNTGNSSRVMVDADGIAGVEVNNNRSMTNMFGISVVPSVGNYTTATVMVNNNNLPDGVDVTNSVIRTTLTEGAIGYMPLSATKGYQIIGVIRLEDGRYPPLGVTVTDKATGRDIGLVADDGFVYLSGIQENSILTLKWNDNVCDMTPPNHSNINGQAIILPCKPAH